MSDWYSEYKEIARTINKCGMKRLKNYCTTKKHPVANFDRDIEIVRYTLRHGPTAGVSKFGMSRQRMLQIPQRYYVYALEAMEVDE